MKGDILMETKSKFGKLTDFAKAGIEKVDVGAIKENAGKAGDIMKQAAGKAGTAPGKTGRSG